VSDWQLTEEDKAQVLADYENSRSEKAFEDLLLRIEALAQCKLMEWMEEECTYHSNGFHYVPRCKCPTCMAQLHRELGEEA